MVREMVFEATRDGKNTHIVVDTQVNEGFIGDRSASDACGLTFYVPNPGATCMTVDGCSVTDLKRNPPDETGRPSVSLVWPILEFPYL